MSAEEERAAVIESYDYDDDEGIWCDRCQGSGIADCHCGGDQCYCDNNGEMECPRCHGEGFYVPTAKQIADEAETAKFMRELWDKLPPGAHLPALDQEGGAK